MKTIIEQSKEQTEQIYSAVFPKILWQFRKGKWPKVIKGLIEPIVKAGIEEAVKESIDYTIKECENLHKVEMEEFKATHIERPSTNFKTRWKFFWTGNFK